MADTKKVKVVQITDVHVDSRDRTPGGVDTWDRAHWACATAADFDPDLVVVTGDIGLHLGTLETYREFHTVLAGLPCDYLMLPGNHDQRSLFADAFGRRYRATAAYPWLDRRVEVGGFVMLLVDSADGRIYPQQLEWLDSILTEEAAAAQRGDGARRLLIWTHHPAITGFHRFMDAEYSLENAHELRAILGRHSGDLELFLFCGHYHCEDTEQWHGIHQFCTPATYVQLDPTVDKLTVTDEGPAIRVIDLPPLSDVQTVVVYRSPGNG